jgi:membrane-associated protein
MSLLTDAIDLFLHLDKHLNQVIGDYGGWTYLILFLIVFCETGLVVTPFLPGDSLLFAAGTIAAGGSLNPWWLIGLLVVAAVAGDAVNYAVGNYLGPKVLTQNRRLLRREHLERTQRFFQKYGGKTIIFARFVPIVRTFAPFMAGVGAMSYRRFAAYNVAGGVVWVVAFVLAGYYFAQYEVVKENFSLVILAIIGISAMPGVFEWWRARGEARRAAQRAALDGASAE